MDGVQAVCLAQRSSSARSDDRSDLRWRRLNLVSWFNPRYRKIEELDAAA